VPANGRARRGWAVVAGTVLVVLVAAAAGAAEPTSAPTAQADPAPWPVYHHDPLGRGQDGSGIDLAAPRADWTSPALDGDLFGEPLVAGGDVYVATENDTVYALHAADGSVAWSTHLGTPVPAGSLPCGDIAPSVGITGTPVIDPARQEIFVVADEEVNGSPAHRLVGLDLSSGAVRTTVDVDPAAADPSTLLQRTGLALDAAGDVVFGYGGNYGDCGTYRGWVISVPDAGGDPATFAVTTTAGSKGAVWMGGGAPVVDGAGHIWVAAGNGTSTSADHYDGSDSVIELSAGLVRLASFAPSDWPSENAGDLDLGSSSPALLPDGLVVQAGKSGTAYLLRQSSLGGIGGQVASVHVCDQDVSGGDAVSGDVVFLPCLSGLVAVQAIGTGQPSLSVRWRSPVGGGPPILAGGLVWTQGNGVLYGLSVATGSVTDQLAVGPAANHFPTPSVGDGLLLATGTDQVRAFADATAVPTTTTVAPTTTTPGARTGPGGARPAERLTSGGTGISAGAVAGGVLGGLALVGVAGWLVLRSRRRRAPGTGPPG